MAVALLSICAEFGGWIVFWYLDPSRELGFREQVLFPIINVFAHIFAGVLVFDQAAAHRHNGLHRDGSFEGKHIAVCFLIFFCAVWPTVTKLNIFTIVYYSYMVIALVLVQPFHLVGTPLFVFAVAGTGMYRLHQLEPTPHSNEQNLGYVFWIVLHGTFMTFVAASFQIQNQELAAAKDVVQRALDQRTNALSFISHECRTPLHGMLGELDLLLQDGALEDSVNETLKTVRHMGWHLLEHLDSMMHLAKAERGMLKLNAVEFALDVQIWDSVALLGPLAKELTCTVTSNLNPRLPALVQGDAIKLRQILINVLSNSIKHASHGKVEVRADPVKHVNSPPADTTLGAFEAVLLPAVDSPGVRFQVSDDGVGMAPEFLKKMFEPFMTDEMQRQHQARSMGLGLVISMELVKVWQGGIWVASKQGQGTIFVITLPLDWPSVVPEPCPAAPLLPLRVDTSHTQAQYEVDDDAPMPVCSPPVITTNSSPITAVDTLHNMASDRKKRGLPLRILCADDNSVNRRLLQGQMKRFGLAAEVAVDGLEALEKCEGAAAEGWAYDIIFMDYHMPRMNGLESSLAIMKIPQFTLCHICLLTADGSLDVDAAIATAAGSATPGRAIDSILIKPVSLQSLAVHVMQIIDPMTSFTTPKAHIERDMWSSPATCSTLQLDRDSDAKSMPGFVLRESPGTENALGLSRAQPPSHDALSF
eukprot:CAMPEP_0114540258 /NCGR_PEP_ID=MMETSP0114-20121206/667_1 /TAXON_ID=31324 /ORGANISM="Goniomonas sp, Strain m" /LENGTH=702 /DNA_ID=CAMNT_0001724399 /DNA_START=111 /DNA_END=2219 /DNA_ORIENTATION=+